MKLERKFIKNEDDSRLNVSVPFFRAPAPSCSRRDSLEVVPLAMWMWGKRREEKGQALTKPAI